MKIAVMCHRPRTQQLGPDSVARELHVIGAKSMTEAKKALTDVKAAHRRMVKAGYPWPGGQYRNFQSEPNDQFYIRLQ